MKGLLVVLVMTALTATATADRKKAERLFRTGEKAYREQKFLAAAQHFELAYKELPAPEIAFSAAQAYRRQYRIDPSRSEYVEKSIEYYEVYLAAVRKGHPGSRAGDAADSLGEMLRERSRSGGSKGSADELAKQTMLGVSVLLADEQQTTSTQMREVEEGKTSTSERTVELTIDGKPQEHDMLHAVEPGVHVIRVRADGYEPVERRVSVLAGAPHSEEIVLQPLPAQITVATEAGATVIVDGRGEGEAPLAKPIAVAGGKHVITVIRAGRRAAAREVTVTRAQQITVDIPLEPTLRRRAVPWVITASAASLVVAGTAGLAARYFDRRAVEHRDILLGTGDQEQSRLDDYNEARTRRDRAITGVWLMTGTAVAVGLTAAWLYYFDSPSSEGVTVTPIASETGLGAAVSGRF